MGPINVAVDPVDPARALLDHAQHMADPQALLEAAKVLLEQATAPKAAILLRVVSEMGGPCVRDRPVDRGERGYAAGG